MHHMHTHLHLSNKVVVQEGGERKWG